MVEVSGSSPLIPTICFCNLLKLLMVQVLDLGLEVILEVIFQKPVRKNPHFDTFFVLKISKNFAVFSAVPLSNKAITLAYLSVIL